MNEPTLYERIGGREAIQATVTKMYDKLLSDDLLKPFFKETDLSKLRRSQTAFMVMAFGGPHSYTGKNLRDAHQPLVNEGLSDEHFDAVATHLAASLEELNVAAELIQEVLSVVSTTRNDVLCK